MLKLPFPPRFQLAQTLVIAILLALSSKLFAAPLSEQKINQWIASQQAFEKWGEQHDERISAYEESDARNDNPFEVNSEQMLKPLRKAGLYDDAAKIARKHGFSSLEEWADLTLRITKTAAAIEMDNHPEMMDISSLQKLLDSPQIPEEQRQVLSKAIEHNQAVMKDINDNVTQADKDALRPHLNRIMKLMEMGDSQ